MKHSIIAIGYDSMLETTVRQVSIDILLHNI